MKVFNILGNRYVGTIGKMVTAAENRGINYMRGYRVPKKPPTPPQEAIREQFHDGVDEWNDFNAPQRTAYDRCFMKRNQEITHYNAMMEDYMKTVIDGDEYASPPFGDITVRDSVTDDPVENAKFSVYREGNSKHIFRAYTDINGKIVDMSFVTVDEPYQIYIEKDGYQTRIKFALTAQQVIAIHEMDPD